MLIDLKRFSPGQELQGGLLTVVEQMPGLVMAADKTQVHRVVAWAVSQQNDLVVCRHGADWHTFIMAVARQP